MAVMASPKMCIQTMLSVFGPFSNRFRLFLVGLQLISDRFRTVLCSFHTVFFFVLFSRRRRREVVLVVAVVVAILVAVVFAVAVTLDMAIIWR